MPFKEMIRDLSWLDDHDALEGLAEIVAERRRQVSKGYDAAHDDHHTPGQLAHMAELRLGSVTGWQRLPGAAVPVSAGDIAGAGALCAALLDRLRRPQR